MDTNVFQATRIIWSWTQGYALEESLTTSWVDQHATTLCSCLGSSTNFRSMKNNYDQTIAIYKSEEVFILFYDMFQLRWYPTSSTRKSNIESSKMLNARLSHNWSFLAMIALHRRLKFLVNGSWQGVLWTSKPKTPPIQPVLLSPSGLLCDLHPQSNNVKITTSLTFKVIGLDHPQPKSCNLC